MAGMESGLLPLMGDIPVCETIRRRRSVRTYSGKPIGRESDERIRQALRELNGLSSGSVRCEFIAKCELIARKDAAVGDGVKLGTYGVVLGAPAFVAAVVDRREGAMEHLGYVFEQVVLYLTFHGLGTCWLGGTFRRTAFAKALHIKENEILPIVSPVGYPSRIRGPADLLFRPLMTKRRAPWHSLFFDGDWATPLDWTAAGSFALPLEMVRLAPSASNKQPWRVLRKDGSFYFFLYGDPAYRRRYEFDIQKIDMGIAMLHFEASAREAGHKGHWENRSLEPSLRPSGFEHIMTWVPE